MTNDNKLQKQVDYDNNQIALIKNMYAQNASNDELKLLLYMSKKYNLDILTRQIWCVKFKNKPHLPAQIYAGRDGFLTIAHRTGKFNGMKSGTRGSKKDNDLVGWCEVYRNDMTNNFYVEVDFSEYTTHKNLWQSKPKTMIQKVAESQALRRAFDISGLYSPEEMSQYEEENKPKEIKMMQQNQRQAIWIKAKENNMTIEELKEFSYNFTEKMDLSKLTYEEAGTLYKKLNESQELIKEVVFIEQEEYEGSPYEFNHK